MSRMALWNGTPAFATKKQLVSSISGLYDDLQDFQFSTISQVSTLNVSQWISAPVLYVSDIKGANIDISGILIDASGIFFAPSISSQNGNFSIVNISTLKFEFNPTFSGDIKVSFDLGLGQAIGGLLGGLGAAVGGAFIGVGTGLGLAIQGAEQGIATIIAGRPQNFINNNVYETINFTSQLQISTLGYDYPLYSTIRREVSSLAADSVPGREIFTSSFFLPGTTCIRSVSDPINLISGNSNLNTSTIQSFGQWVPFEDSSPTGNASFSSVLIQQSNLATPYILKGDVQGTTGSVFMVDLNTYINPVTAEYPNPPNPYDIAQSCSNNSLLQFSEFGYDLTFTSTPYLQYTSTLGSYGTPVYFITSSITDGLSSIPLFIYTGSELGGADIAICEKDETNFLSTGVMDFVAQSSNILLQWGLAVDNLNSTIAFGTAKRVSWDIPNNYSNFIDIPPVPSSIVTGTRAFEYAFQTRPQEIIFQALDAGPFGPTIGQPIGLALNVNSATFGDLTTFCNVSNYPYQFNGNTFINGTLEANTIIALSSIIAVSTFAQTLFSTNIIEASSGIFTSTQTEKAHIQTGFISTLKASDNWANDYITTLSRVRMAGFQTPLSIVTGNFSNLYDYTHRFDFVTDISPQAVYIQSEPNNKTIMTITSTNVEIENLNVGNLTAGTLVYSNAEAPYIETSTIEFGWTGSFDYGGPVAYSMQQYLSTPLGTYWTNYIAASNQVLNIMNFNNQVNMLAQQFSTPLEYTTATFGGSNREGWASTIFYNATGATARVNLESNAGPGELSLQASQNNIVVNMNSFLTSNLEGLPIGLVVPSTLRFVSDGSQWNVSYIPPKPGNISYSNSFQMSLDFENLNISTSDTLNINAETINLNGQVVAPNLQLENLYLDGFLSSLQVRADSVNGYVSLTNYTGSLEDAPNATPLNLQYNITSTDFTNIRQTLIPSRGFNSFNSFNYAEWNNTQFNIDTNTSAGRPTMIVGELLQLSPPRPAYAGQFWVNNKIDSPALVIPIYQNVEGVLSTIGNIAGNTYARVYTPNGTQWLIQPNVPDPQGTTTSTYNNFYQVAMNSAVTTINSGMPMIYNMPSLVYNTNKTLFYSPQIRVATIDAPSFNTREAGMEQVFYYDGSVVFSGGPENWESEAFNPIVNYTGNSYYSIAGWMCDAKITRIRTDNDIPTGWEIEARAYPVGGGAIDYIWGSYRYIKVRTIGNPAANIREAYLMIPKNYFNFLWQGQGPINQ